MASRDEGWGELIEACYGDRCVKFRRYALKKEKGVFERQCSLSKFMPPKIPRNGLIISSTSDDTILVKAPPIIIPTALNPATRCRHGGPSPRRLPDGPRSHPLPSGL